MKVFVLSCRENVFGPDPSDTLVTPVTFNDPVAKVIGPPVAVAEKSPLPPAPTVAGPAPIARG